MKVAFRILPALVVALLASAVARAEILPSGPHNWRSSRASDGTADWRQGRAMVGGGWGVPGFPAGWRPGAGWSTSLINPQQPWLDVVVDIESFEHHFDPGRLHVSGASEIRAAGHAFFSDVALGVRLHPPALGRRWYGVAELALPDVSLPAVFYRDASGNHTIDGVEIFGFDPGFVLGFGYEYCEHSRIGGMIEARLVVAPGRTEPTQYLSLVRAGLAVPLPF